MLIHQSQIRCNFKLFAHEISLKILHNQLSVCTTTYIRYFGFKVKFIETNIETLSHHRPHIRLIRIVRYVSNYIREIFEIISNILDATNSLVDAEQARILSI